MDRTVCIKILGEKFEGILDESANWMEGLWKIGVFRPTSRFISKTVQDTAIVTMEDE